MSPEIALISYPYVIGHNMVAFALTTSCLTRFYQLFKFVTFFIIPVWFFFVFEHENIYTGRMLAAFEFCYLT